MQDKEMKEDKLKFQRKQLLQDILERIQSHIKLQHIKGENTKKTFLYSRLAEFTDYSEVSIRKYFTGIIPKNTQQFVNGILEYAKTIQLSNDYLEQFEREYYTACHAVIIEEKQIKQVQHNFIIQDLSTIVHHNRLDDFLTSFLKSPINICYIYGYPLSGKTTAVKAYFYNYIGQMIPFSSIIWCEFRKKESQLEYILETIFQTLEIQIGEIQNSKEEMCLFLLKKLSVVLILDMSSEELEKETIAFLKRAMTTTKIVLISSIVYEQYEEILTPYCKPFSMNVGYTKEEIIHMMEMQENLKVLTTFRKDIIDSIYELCGGFPFASLYIAKKIIKENKYGESLDEVIEHYRNFTDQGYEELSTKIIDESWEEISELAHKILCIIALFKCSISLNLISFLCQVSMQDASWKEALKQCYDRGILKHVISNHPRCHIHPLIRTLVLSKIKREHCFDFEIFYARLSEYYKEVSSHIQECYDDLDKMKVLDEIDEFETVQETLDMLYENNYASEYIQIDHDLKYYIYTRGYWKIGENSSRIKRAKLAKQIGDKNAELEAYCDYINLMAKQKNKLEAETYLAIASPLVSEQGIQKRIIALYYHVKALYYYNCCNRYEEAYQLWQYIQKEYAEDTNTYRHLTHQLWLDRCLIKLEKDTDKIEKALIKDEKEATEKNFTRGMIDYYLLLANLKLEQFKQTKQDSLIRKRC